MAPCDDLWEAIENCAEDTVKDLLDEHAKSLASLEDHCGYTPLLKAAHKGNAPIFKMLIAAGADVKVINSKSGDTVLHFAAAKANVEISNQAIQYGANIFATDKHHNETCLHKAVVTGEGTIVDALLRAAPPDQHADGGKKDWIADFIAVVNIHGMTAAELARSKGFKAVAAKIEHAELEIELLKDGAEVLKEGKLLVCGFEKVGKTTLVYNASENRGPKPTEVRTAGFDVIRMNIPGAGDEMWTVVDFAGHMEYYVTHEMMLKTTNAIFIVMCNLEDIQYVEIESILFVACEKVLLSSCCTSF